MKSLFVASFLLIFSTTIAQEMDEKVALTSKGHVIYHNQSKIVEFHEDVDFQDDLLKFAQADQVILNYSTKEIIAFGIKNFQFKGAVEINPGSPHKGILKYRIGESIAFLE